MPIQPFIVSLEGEESCEFGRELRSPGGREAPTIHGDFGSFPPMITSEGGRFPQL